MEKKMMKRDLVEEARQLRLQQEALAEQAKELEKKVKLARGTERIRKPTVPARPQVIVKPARGPYWTGNDGSTRELMQMIERMLMERPWFYRDICEATGAGENRIKGAITALQREGHRVVDVAPPHTGRALWFIPSDEVMTRIARVKRATERK